MCPVPRKQVGRRVGSRSSRALVAALGEGLRSAGLPEHAIQLVPTRDRDAVGMMLKMSGVIDIIVPRGGASLIERVQRESRIPVIAHLEGLCHTYIHAGADPEKARSIVLNAKMRRVSVCGATETLLIDRAIADILLLTRKDMEKLFPDAEIVVERFAGMTKSIIARKR